MTFFNLLISYKFPTAFLFYEMISAFLFDPIYFYKPRLGPLNLKQLEELREKTQQKKNKAKIAREIAKRLALQAV